MRTLMALVALAAAAISTPMLIMPTGGHTTKPDGDSALIAFFMERLVTGATPIGPAGCCR